MCFQSAESDTPICLPWTKAVHKEFQTINKNILKELKVGMTPLHTHTDQFRSVLEKTGQKKKVRLGTHQNPTNDFKEPFYFGGLNIITHRF